MVKAPLRAVLIQNEKFLIVGFIEGALFKLSLKNPINPKIILAI